MSSKPDLQQIGHRPLAVDAQLFRLLGVVDVEVDILIVLVADEETVLSIAPCCWPH